MGAPYFFYYYYFLTLLMVSVSREFMFCIYIVLDTRKSLWSNFLELPYGQAIIFLAMITNINTCSCVRLYFVNVAYSLEPLLWQTLIVLPCPLLYIFFSTVMGIPSITSNLSGFGCFIQVEHSAICRWYDETPQVICLIQSYFLKMLKICCEDNCSTCVCIFHILF